MASDLTIITRAPDIVFDVERPAPPSVLYVGPLDELAIEHFGSVAAGNLTLRARLLLANGSIVPYLFDIPISSNRAYGSTTVRLAEGYLLSLFLWVTSASRRGQAYAQVSISRPVTGAGTTTAMQVLTRGYPSLTEAIGWPPGISEHSLDGAGFLRVVSGTTPAAGNEVSETTPSNVRWKLRAVRFYLTTSATVANRLVRLTVDNGVTSAWFVEAPVVQAASLTRGYNWVAGGVSQAAVVDEHMIALPVDIWLIENWRIRSLTDSLQAGDAFATVRLYVEEWIEE